MNELLRPEFEKYLAQHGLKPRKLPPKNVREASRRNVIRIMYGEAKERDDPMAEDILIRYEKERGRRSLEDSQHPATVQIEKAAKEVEATIQSLPNFARRFQDNIFVGEFPTGSINCHTVKVDGGYLILVNSGTLAVIQQAVNFLWRGNPDDPASSESLLSADGIAEILATYVRDGDPFYGPALDLGAELDLNKLLRAVGTMALSQKGSARELAQLVKDYAGYLDIRLGHLPQRMIDVQLNVDSGGRNS
jgi:hypothetical protein